MRIASIFLVVAMCAVAVNAAMTKDQANTPADYLTLNPDNYNYMCLLKSLSFTNGLNIIPSFTANNFHYSCSCATFDTLASSMANVQAYDDMSVVEFTVNGVDYNTRAAGNAISNHGDVPNAPAIGASSVFPVRDGNNLITLGVTCNSDCYYQYNISCYKPPSSFVVGDPQFVGLRGQSYQVHGVAGEVYNIISDRDLQYNSQFVFLDQGECPVINGKKAKGCWSHSGSYLGELGLKTRGGDRIHVKTGSAKQGFVAVELNGKQLEIGETIQLKENMGSISLNSTHEVAMTIGVWQFNFENSDKFVNQRVKVADARNLKSHGLLGQTWRTTTYPNQQIKYVQGAVDDYAIRDRDIFGDNFVYNTFN